MISKINDYDVHLDQPFELLNFGNSNIDVVMPKECYLNYFANKTNNIGVFCDEDMGFAQVFFCSVADSFRNGFESAEGHIGVTLKIYRVKNIFNPIVDTETKQVAPSEDKVIYRRNIGFTFENIQVMVDYSTTTVESNLNNGSMMTLGADDFVLSGTYQRGVVND